MICFPRASRKVIQHGNWAGCRIESPSRRVRGQKCDQECPGKAGDLWVAAAQDWPVTPEQHLAEQDDREQVRKCEGQVGHPAHDRCAEAFPS